MIELWSQLSIPQHQHLEANFTMQASLNPSPRISMSCIGCAAFSWRWGWCLLITSALFACGGGGDAASPSQAPITSTSPISTIGIQRTSTISSNQVGVNYSLRIYLPAGYQANTAYPIIYALDGDTNFSSMVSILDQASTPVILVAIGGSDRRTQDYNFPGSYTYYKFLTQELIPFIEQQYPSLKTQRTLEGHSFGGLFVGTALFLDRQGGQFFKNFIAQEGTFNVDAATLATISQLEQQTFATSGGKMPVTVLLSGATQYYYKANLDFYQQLTQRHYEGLTIRLTEYNQSHGGMFSDSFAEAIKFLFPK